MHSARKSTKPDPFKANAKRPCSSSHRYTYTCRWAPRQTKRLSHTFAWHCRQVHDQPGTHTRSPRHLCSFCRRPSCFAASPAIRKTMVLIEQINQAKDKGKKDKNVNCERYYLQSSQSSRSSSSSPWRQSNGDLLRKQKQRRNRMPTLEPNA